MSATLEQHLQRYVILSSEELHHFTEKLQRRTYAKGEHFLTEGEPSRYVAFIREGILRYYFIKDGEERTGQFFFEGTWVADYFSFLTKRPSEMYIDVIEDADLLLLSYENMQTLYAEIPKIERFGRLIAEQIFIGSHLRTTSFLRESPQERYLRLINERPKVIERIPQYLIASYLGIKPESLSRIRKRIWRDKHRS